MRSIAKTEKRRCRSTPSATASALAATSSSSSSSPKVVPEISPSMTYRVLKMELSSSLAPSTSNTKRTRKPNRNYFDEGGNKKELTVDRSDVITKNSTKSKMKISTRAGQRGGNNNISSDGRKNQGKNKGQRKEIDNSDIEEVDSEIAYRKELELTALTSSSSLPKRTRKPNRNYFDEGGNKKELTVDRSDVITKNSTKSKMKISTRAGQRGGNNNISSDGRKNQGKNKGQHKEIDNSDIEEVDSEIEYRIDCYVEEVSDEDAFTSGLGSGSSSSPTSSSFSCDSCCDYFNDCDSLSTNGCSLEDCEDLNGSIESTDFLLFPISDFNVNPETCFEEEFGLVDGSFEGYEKDKDEQNDTSLTIKLPTSIWKKRDRDDVYDDDDGVNMSKFPSELSFIVLEKNINHHDSVLLKDDAHFVTLDESVDFRETDGMNKIIGLEEIKNSETVANFYEHKESEDKLTTRRPTMMDDEEEGEEDYTYSRSAKKTRFSIDELQADLEEYSMKIAQEYGIFIDEK